MMSASSILRKVMILGMLFVSATSSFAGQTTIVGLSDEAKATIRALSAARVPYSILHAELPLGENESVNQYIILAASTDGLGPQTQLPSLEASGESSDDSISFTWGVHAALMFAAWTLPKVGVWAFPNFFKQDLWPKYLLDEGKGLLFDYMYFVTDGNMPSITDLHDQSSILNVMMSYIFLPGYYRNESAADNAAVKFKRELAEKISNNELDPELVVVVKQNLFTRFKNKITDPVGLGYRQITVESLL